MLISNLIDFGNNLKIFKLRIEEEGPKVLSVNSLV